MRREVQARKIGPITDVSKCIFCNSNNIKIFGVSKNKSGDIQRFLCCGCGKTFSVNIGFERMKHNPQAITSAVQLCFGGESLGNTKESLKLLGVEVSHKKVFMWIKKCVKLMQNYV